MSKNNLIKKSLYKFLNDNLDIFITYDSNKSELITISDLKSQSDLSSPITQIILTQYGNLFKTDEDLVGRVVNIGELGLIDTVASWDNITSTLTLTSGFSEDITTSEEISIILEKLIFMNSEVFSLPDRKTKRHNRGINNSCDLLIKVKNDSDKAKINTILDAIDDLFESNYYKFPIYDDNLIEILSYATIENLSKNKVIDIDNDIQTYLINFLIKYYVRYM